MRPATAIIALIGLVVLTAGAVLHVTDKQVHACSYPAIPLEKKIEDADFIFRGQVLSIDGLRIRGDEFEDIVEFKAIEVWKGEPYETMYVRSWWKLLTREDMQGPCPPTLFHRYTIGAEYLVFVNGGQANVGSGVTTQRIESASSILEKLGDGTSPKPSTVGPIPERKVQPVETQSGGSCNLVPVNGSGSSDMSAVGLGVVLVWIWLRQRLRR